MTDWTLTGVDMYPHKALDEIERLTAENLRLQSELDAATKLLDGATIWNKGPAANKQEPCGHTWSDPRIGEPPIFCTKCLTPKVRIEDIDPAADRQKSTGFTETVCPSGSAQINGPTPPADDKQGAQCKHGNDAYMCGECDEYEPAENRQSLADYCEHMGIKGDCILCDPADEKQEDDTPIESVDDLTPEAKAMGLAAAENRRGITDPDEPCEECGEPMDGADGLFCGRCQDPAEQEQDS